MTVEQYWESQAPKTMQYLFKRMNQFFVYTESGVHDPLGAEIFKLLGKEIVKEVAVRSRKARLAGEGLGDGPTEGRKVKAMKQKLANLKAELNQPTYENLDVADEGEYIAKIGEGPIVGEIEDDF